LPVMDWGLKCSSPKVLIKLAIFLPQIRMILPKLKARSQRPESKGQKIFVFCFFHLSSVFCFPGCPYHLLPPQKDVFSKHEYTKLRGKGQGKYRSFVRMRVFATR